MDEGNYTVQPEANGEHSDPIWIVYAVLTALRAGGGEQPGQERAAKRKVEL